MANHDHISTFTALDIERYQKGLLSPAERHQMEKAALEDPFLADAMEGYASTIVDIPTDLAELKRRLAEKEESRKVIPITGGSRSIPWLRIAAIFLLLIGAGFLAYRFVFDGNKKETIVQQEPVVVKPATDTPIEFNNIETSADSATKQGTAKVEERPETKETITAPPLKKQDQSVAATPDPSPTQAETKDVTDALAGKTAGVNVTPAQPDTRNDYYKAKQDADELKKLEKATAVAADDRRRQANADAPAAMDKKAFVGMDTANVNQQAFAKKKAVNYKNIYRGRVVDAQNNPLPFANVTNRADNVGTYSDAQGNFILTSPDSVLNVQVRSLGFENNNVALQRNASGNRVVMENDNDGGNAIVVSRKKVNSDRSRNSTVVFDQPEPLDGWENYDVYLANNLNEPEQLATKERRPRGEVELSFDVNQYGEAINIKVVRSLCNSCDQEAIRLIKSGPKWKPNKKKGTVTVSF